MEDGDGDQALTDDIDLNGVPSCSTSEKVMKALIPSLKDEGIQTPCSILLPAVEENSLLKCVAGMESKEIEVPKVKVNGEVGSKESEGNDLENAYKDGTDIAPETESEELPLPKPINMSEVDSEQKSRKRKLSDSLVTNDVKDDGSSSDGNLEIFKGFKKRMLAQSSVTVVDKENVSSMQESQLFLSLTKTNATDLKKKIDSTAPSRGETSLPVPKPNEEPSTPQAEYAQYLGLQPTVKFKCYKCGETGFPSMLKLQDHQNTCLTNLNIHAVPKSIIPHVPLDPSPSTNFRITRKVYLCSSCGTYYENWNLFLHMRQVHKRHICLFCLAMFSQADKLATHLISKHNIVETNYDSPQHLFKECNGSCFLMCISCECVFSERDNFISHACKEVDLVSADKPCSLCYLRGTHLPTCRLALVNSNSSSLPTTSQVHTLGNTLESTRSSQLPVHGSNVSVRKFLLPVSSVQPNNNKKKLSTAEDEKSLDLSDIDDDYDISNAASFCHVNIHEQPEKKKPIVISKLKVNTKTRSDISSSTEDNLQVISLNVDDAILQSEKDISATVNDLTEEKVSSLHFNNTATINKDDVETSTGKINALEVGEDITCNEPIIHNIHQPDRSYLLQGKVSSLTGLETMAPINYTSEDESSSNGLLSSEMDVKTIPISSLTSEAIQVPSKTEIKFTELPSKAECNISESFSKSEVNKPAIKIASESRESALRSELDCIETASNTLPAVDNSDSITVTTALKPVVDGPASLPARETEDATPQERLELSGPTDTSTEHIDPAIVDKMSKSTVRKEIKSSPILIKNLNKNERNINQGNDNVNNTSSPLSEVESTKLVISVDTAASKTPPVKKSKRKRSQLTMKISRSIPNVHAQSANEFSGNSKTPLTVKFKLIKTSSESCANYTAAVDGNHMESDHSGSDRNAKDTTTSSSESFSKVKMRKRSRKGVKSSKGNRKTYNMEDEVIQENKLEDLTILENIQVAGEEVTATEIHLEERLEMVTIQGLLQESVKTSCLSCVFCNHAKKIAVNGKQLALHLLAEHRFIPVYKNDSSSIKSHLSIIDEPILKDKIHSNGEEGDREPTVEESESIRLKNNELISDYVTKLKSSLSFLNDLFLNTDTYDSSDRTFMHPYDRTYECFHCHFLTTLHKELYVHNRKMHQKTILLCIMCKSNFYSYSELLCHLCPGIYVPDNEIKFRCCVCLVDSLPSAFRLMVHLRKRHHTCDVCLETTSDQQKLSNHVWKHKLHHLCYRCGIAYRNKPDITKHLFWKHGTESVLCKKCLQKKWPHVYHFCVPPNAFICEECNSSFSRAVALKVHKRLHAGELPYGCDECEERFVSKKLLARHQISHREIPIPEEVDVNVEDIKPSAAELGVVALDYKAKQAMSTPTRLLADPLDSPHAAVESSHQDKCTPDQADVPAAESPRKESKKHSHKKQKPKIVDVYDLPPLNLSSDSDESGDEKAKPLGLSDVQLPIVGPTTYSEERSETTNKSESENVSHTEEETQIPVATVDGVWDNFQNYKANLERRESQSNDTINSSLPFPLNTMTSTEVFRIIMSDHDYCATSETKKGTGETESVDQCLPGNSSSDVGLPEQQKGIADGDLKSEVGKNDHDYCSNTTTNVGMVGEEHQEKLVSKIAQVDVLNTSNDSPSKKKSKVVKKKRERMSSSSSDSSSNSGSSSCSCGTNCSCSSSSSSSSGSTSDSSESDSSSSEGRRRQIERREKRRERGKKKNNDSSLSALPTTGPVEQEEVQLPPPIPTPTEPEEIEVLIHESDLDTDETETDEDFYDQHPQLLANKLLAEKRNQLLLLAAVAPVSISTQAESSPPPSPLHTSTKKKVKSKKRKKRQHEAERKTESKQKHSVSVGHYMNQIPNTDTFQRTANQLHSPINQPPPPQLPQVSTIQKASDAVALSAAYSAESGSETDSKRLSKRRRLPKKFYGDSSDEDAVHPPPHSLKWPRNIPAVSSTPVPSLPQSPPAYKNSIPVPEPAPARVPPIIIVPAPEVPDKSDEEDEDELVESESEQEIKKTSSDSSSNSEAEKDVDSGSENEVPPPPIVPPLIVHAPAPSTVHKKNENLYCYCQCPYDEVSEMIACDGKDCVIEWFHFECVGIMVPPKGKWYCPDCRKRASLKP